MSSWCQKRLARLGEMKHCLERRDEPNCAEPLASFRAVTPPRTRAPPRSRPRTRWTPELRPRAPRCCRPARRPRGKCERRSATTVARHSPRPPRAARATHPASGVRWFQYVPCRTRGPSGTQLTAARVAVHRAAQCRGGSDTGQGIEGCAPESRSRLYLLLRPRIAHLDWPAIATGTCDTSPLLDATMTSYRPPSPFPIVASAFRRFGRRSRVRCHRRQGSGTNIRWWTSSGRSWPRWAWWP